MNYYAPQRPAPTASPKSGGVAVILSLLICGLGHLYTGNPVWAIFWFAAAVISGILTTVLVGVVLLPLVWIAAAISAYSCAASFNRRHHAIR